MNPLVFRLISGLFGVAAFYCLFTIVRAVVTGQHARAASLVILALGLWTVEDAVREWLGRPNTSPPLHTRQFLAGWEMDALFLAATVGLSLLWLRLRPGTPSDTAVWGSSIGVIALTFVGLILALALHLMR